jgi:SRSO17 transposase
VVGFLEGPTMVRRTSDWRDELGRWLKPFLDRLGHKARRQMCPLYVSGLIGPGDRKSIQPMAKRLALGECDQLHHFIAAGVGMQRQWKQNCLSKQIGSSAATMPCW